MSLFGLLAPALPYLTLFLTLCLAVGGALAFRQGYSKTASEIQERVIAALKGEIETLEMKVLTCEQETFRQKRVLATVRYALKRLGFRIIVNGDFITLVEIATEKARTTAMRSAAEMRAAVKDEQDADDDEEKTRPTGSKGST